MSTQNIPYERLMNEKVDYHQFIEEFIKPHHYNLNKDIERILYTHYIKWNKSITSVIENNIVYAAKTVPSFLQKYSYIDISFNALKVRINNSHPVLMSVIGEGNSDNLDDLDTALLRVFPGRFSD